MIEGLYDFHGVSFRVQLEQQAWMEAFHEIFREYAAAEATGDGVLQARAVLATASVPPDLRSASRDDEIAFFTRGGASKEIWIRAQEQIWTRVDPKAAAVETWVDPSATEALGPGLLAWVVVHHGVHTGLVELLKRRGFHPVHAGVLARRGEGLVLCGPSGSGKTTLTLSLAMGGWEFLTDDSCFLREQDEELQVIGVREDVNVTAATVKRLPQLAFLAQRETRHREWKKTFSVADLPQILTGDVAQPRWLVFPRVGEEGPSQIRALRPIEAMTRVVPQAVNPVDEGLVEAQTRALARLVREAPAFEIVMGPDLQEVQRVLEKALKET